MKSGDRVIATGLYYMTDVPPGTRGTVSDPIHPDPLKKLIAIEWDNGTKSGVYPRDIKKEGK